jgi:hypothetical protein
MNNSDNKSNEKDYTESQSITMNLENLKTQYKNLLIQYQQATVDYTNYLQGESKTPCGSYGANSTNISQTCYNDIWKKGGCTTQARQLSSMSGSSSVTLNSWILDTFNWATMTDSDHRMGCYGHYDSPYLIIGVGTNGYLYSRQGLNGTWAQISDDSNGNILSICTGSDGKTIWGVNIGNDISIKTTWDAPHWQSPVDGWGSLGYPFISGTNTQMKFLSIAQASDGTLVAVGTDHQLWTTPNSQTGWTNVGTSESENAVCIGPNGRVIVANGIDLYYKDSYQNLQNQTWKYGCPGCCQDITVAPDGTFMDAGGCPQLTDNQIWTMDSYLNLNGGWKGPYPSSCCIKSLTTVTNSTSGYSTATQPNYNINQGELTAVKGEAFWGTGQVGSQSPYTNITIEECKALCSSTNGCSGATYNPTAHGQSMCWLRSGDATPIPALDTDYSILPEGKELLMNMENINQQLIDTNNQILKLVGNGGDIYNAQSSARKSNAEELIQNYIQLTVERDKILKMVNQYQSLDQEQLQGNIKINQHYYSYLLLLALAIVVIYILYKSTGGTISVSPEQIIKPVQALGSNIYYIIFGIILTILLFIYFSNIISFIRYILSFL